ncbi:DUF1330 domain-containing protein [Microvirga sp. TS319]|uniref:DUF1330 domain-containing protein n=1 Tax=Microvirga sp. TS319 TaxID=3241165 RepID=UPI00351A582D
MPAYAVARLYDVAMGPDIVAYLQKIDATLAPFKGRYMIHGGPVDSLEGAWSGDLIMIEFPDRARARDWYASAAYRAILPLRTRHSKGDVILIDGVPDDHQAADILAA